MSNDTASRSSRARPKTSAKQIKLCRGGSPDVLTLRAELLDDAMQPVAALAGLPGLKAQVMLGRDALWVIVRREGKGGLAIRAAHCPGGCRSIRSKQKESGWVFHLETLLGAQRVTVTLPDSDLPLLRVSASLTPLVPVLVPYLPRDLYPLGADGDPLTSAGTVEAAQRGLNSGLCFFHLDDPGSGSVLYFQNLTALNPYFRATKTKPDAAVGGEWPELGYRPPTPPTSGTPVTDPLPAGKPVTLSDAIIVLHTDPAKGERDSAHRFIQMLAAAYRQLDLPAVDVRDWPDRARRTLRDLEEAPEATIRHYGHRYVHPYTASEYPDSMVQVSIVAALQDYATWRGTSLPLLDGLAAGIRKFYDGKLGTLRRYLPNVGKDKNRNAVDSWYLYHPLLNLGHMALAGDKRAHRLFIRSLDFAIRAARHFNYEWPIQYDVRDFSVIDAARDDEGLGQTDVGGLYAYVMLQAHAITGDQRYVEEARHAIEAARDMRFELNYQANLTAWGAAACVRLWRVTNEEDYLRQSYVYLASFLHNCAIWESEIGHAAHYRNFLGATCLHDAPYMAVYECFDSFRAFEHYLHDSGPALDPAARLLIGEYCRYVLDRAWFYYPDTLPKDALATEIRNGHINPKLSFPLEDLYVDGQPAGQVGQEIYGAGAAFTFATRAFHHFDGVPFQIYCDHFLFAMDRGSIRSIGFQLYGGDGCTALLRLRADGRRRLPEMTVTTGDGRKVRAGNVSDGQADFLVPAHGRVTIAWTDQDSRK